jgi:hypothetical protein
MRFCYVFPLADTNKILDQTIATFRQSLTDTCDLLYKVLESVKGLIGSVADPGSGIRCLFDPWIRDRFFPDPGSRIPDPKPIYLRAY